MKMYIDVQPLTQRSVDFFMNNRRLSFVMGALAVPVLLALLFFIFQLTVTKIAGEPHTAELEYASFSLRTGADGGSVIPASCDSGVEHWAGDLAGCTPMTPIGHLDGVWCSNSVLYASGWTCDPDRWTDGLGVHIYTGGTHIASGVANGYRADLGGVCGGTYAHAFTIALPSWLSDNAGRPFTAYSLDNYNFGFAGNPQLSGSGVWAACNPPPSAIQPPVITGRTCYPNADARGPVVHITWAGVAGATRYLPRMAGANGTWCQQVGWTWDGSTCYNDWIGTAQTDGWFLLVPGQPANFWIHAGDPVGGYNQTGAFRCSAPPIGYIGDATCGSTPGSGNVWGWACDPDSWGTALNVHIYRDGPAGVGVFVGSTVANLEGPSLAPYCGGTTAHVFSYTIPESLRDNGYHTYYAHAIDVDPGGVPGASGNPLLLGGPKGATCTMPAPTNASVTCDPSGTQATMSWTGVPGYSTYYTRVSTGGFGLGPFVAGTSDNFVGTSNTFPVTPGQPYFWWLHTKHPTTGSWSAHTPLPTGGTFTCAAAPPPPPPLGAPTVSIEAFIQPSGTPTGGPLNVTAADNVTITWSSTNATACTATAGAGFSTGNATGGSDTDVVEPAAGSNTTYSVSCSGAGGTGSDSVTVSAAAPPTPPAITLTATPSLIRSGDQARLTWSVTAPYPVRCILTGNGSSATFDYTTVGTSVNSPNPYLTTPISNSTNFTLTCSPNPAVAGVTSASASARVDVIPEQQEI